MTDLRSRVEYLRGLSEGLGLDSESKEGKMIAEMLQVFGQVAEKVEDLASDQEDLEVYLDVVDSDLQDLEDDFYGGPDYTAEITAGETDLDELEGEGTSSLGGDAGDTYPCPNCGIQVHGPASGAGRYEGRLGSGGPVAVMLTCPNCGTAFHVARAGEGPPIRPEDDSTDLPYATKE